MTTCPNHDVLASLRRQHLLSFVMQVFATLEPGKPPLEATWYLEALCFALEQVEAGQTTRLVINIPPRHLKSITTSVAFAAWLLGRDPTKRIMVVTYSLDLARKHSEDTATVMNSEWYRRLFPRTQLRSDRQLELVTTAGGCRKAVSLTGTMTGFGADIILIDDLMKAGEGHSVAALEEVRRIFDNTVMTRLNDNELGAIVSIQQRLHEHDLPAYLLEKGYASLILPAIAERDEMIPIGPGIFHERRSGTVLDETRQNRSLLEQTRRDIGAQVFAAQFQQNPVAPGGNLIRLEWFARVAELPARDACTCVIQSCDTAMSASPTADYSVVITFGFYDGLWYVLDVFRERLDYPDLKRAVVRQARTWRPDKVVIEDAGAGTSLWQDLRSERSRGIRHGFVPIVLGAQQSKEERLIGQTGQLEAGLVVLPSEAAWLDALSAEFRAFPFGRHDDQVDCLSQFLEFIMRRPTLTAPRNPDTGRLISRPRHHRVRRQS